MARIQRSALVPVSLIGEQEAGCFLRSVYSELPEDVDTICKEIPRYGAVLVYEAGEGRCIIADLLESLPGIPDHNRIIASMVDGALYLVVSRDDDLLLANAYPAPDFTTAEYYIFLAMKSLQLNPEQSVIRFASPLDEEQEMSLGRYFMGVELL